MTDTQQVARDATIENQVWGEWVGRVIYIATVTHHYVGRLEFVTQGEFWISEASWIPDDGRFNETLKDGSFDELEPFPTDEPIPVGRSGLITACPIAIDKPPRAVR